MRKIIDKEILEDFEWLHLIQQHNDSALVCLMRKYYSDLFKYGLKFTADEELIKICIHDVFVTLWKDRSVAGKILSARLYFLKAMRYRLQKEAMCHNSDKQKFLQFNNNASVCKAFAETAAYKIDQNNLSKTEQEVIYLKYCQNLANAEIANLMNIDQNSVCQLQLFAINKLHNRMKQLHFLS